MTEALNLFHAQPARAKAAEAACVYHMTDGFCHPRNCSGCKCWSAVSDVQAATALSYRAISWIFANLQTIEKQATPPQPPKTLSAEQLEGLESVRHALRTLVNAAYCSPSFESIKSEINQGRVAAAKLDRLLEGNADAL